jgi:hypothetical protein
MKRVDDYTLLIVDNQRKIQALKFFKLYEENRIMKLNFMNFNARGMQHKAIIHKFFTIVII